MEKKHIMVYAYLHYNLGDDLMIKILCDRYPNIQFAIYAYPEYTHTLFCCNNLKVYSNYTMHRKLINYLGRTFGVINAYERMLAKRCDACVCIGGSLFIQANKNWRMYLDYMSSRVIEGIPYFLIGSNFGPYTDSDFLSGFKKIFASYTDICFREQYTADLFSDLENIRVAPDVVLSGVYNKYISVRENKRVAVSMIDLTNRIDLFRYKEDYLKCIEQICRQYLDQGYTVDLLSFCKSEGDENAVLELERRLAEYQVEHHLYQTEADIEKMLHCIGSAEVVIATRYHAMILGWCMGKKTLPIIYSLKMKHVIEELHFPGQVIQIERNMKVSKVNPGVFDISNIANKAQSQFKALDIFLGTDNLAC